MKTKRSFSAWILGIYAAVLVKFFPTLCVKKYTKKSNKNAGVFLPGKKKELAAIEKLSLDDDALRARVWSKETRVALLQPPYCRDALLLDIQTEEEFDCIIGGGTLHGVFTALKVYTPSKAKLLSFVQTCEIDYLRMTARELPRVFSGLKTWEILGVAKETPYKRTERWAVAKELIMANPEWAVPFMREVNKIPPRQRVDDALAVFKKAFDVAFETKADMSDLMVVMSVINPDMYNTVCENYYRYKDFSPYFKVMFPKVLEYLDDSVDDIRLVSKPLDDKNRWRAEAFRWLSIGYYQIGNPRILAVLISSWAAIREKVSKEMFAQLCLRAADNVSSASLGKQLRNILPSKYHPTLLTTMLSLKDEADRFIWQFFPFEGVEKEVAVAAIKACVQAKNLPVEHLDKLPEDLYKIAFEEMEILSQIEIIEGGSTEERCFLLSKKLYAQTECHLFKTERFGEEILVYLKAFEVSDEVFKTLLVAAPRYGILGKKLLCSYAEKWGLSEKKYVLLMQSSLSYLAPLVAQYRIGTKEQ